MASLQGVSSWDYNVNLPPQGVTVYTGSGCTGHASTGESIGSNADMGMNENLQTYNAEAADNDRLTSAKLTFSSCSCT